MSRRWRCRSSSRCRARGHRNRRRIRNRARRRRFSIGIAHVERLLAGLARGGLALACNRKLQHLEIAGSQLVGLVCSGPAQREFMYFVGLGYPVVAPLVLYQHEGATRSLAIEWDGMADADASVERTAALLYAAMGGRDASGPAPRSEPPRAAPARPSHAT